MTSRRSRIKMGSRSNKRVQRVLKMSTRRNIRKKSIIAR